MTCEGQAGAAKEQSTSESQSRAFRADTSHHDPQLSRSSQNDPYLGFDPAQSCPTTEIQRKPTCPPWWTTSQSSTTCALPRQRHAVPSVMEAHGEAHVRREEANETILESDVDETHCPQQLADLRSQKESWKLSQHSSGANPGTSRCTDRQHGHDHTHKVVEKIIKDAQSHAASCERTGCNGCLKTGSSSEHVANKHVQQVVNTEGAAIQHYQEDDTVRRAVPKIITNTAQRKNPIIQEKINQVSKQVEFL